MPNQLTDILLKLDGIDGESTVRGHEKEIAVLSYEQVVDVDVIHSGGGGGASSGRARFSGVRFRKNVDMASIPILLACCSGTHIREARFTFRRAAGGFEFYKVTLDDVLVTHVGERAGTGAQYPLSFDTLQAGDPADGFLDEVALNFSRIRWEHRAQRPDGSAGTTTSGGWDVRSNTRL